MKNSNSKFISTFLLLALSVSGGCGLAASNEDRIERASTQMEEGDYRAIEAIAHGDRKTSKVVGRSVEEIKLPEGATIAAMVRGTQVIIAHHDTVIESGDHVILLLVSKKRISEVTRLFSVGVTFL